MSRNKFTAVPDVVWELPNLETLDLTSNLKLEKLDVQIQNMDSMRELILDACPALQEPPLAVTTMGLGAIKEYYKALSKDQGLLVPSLTVGIIGASFSGKTSLVQSLKAGQRKLTFRQEGSDDDETTVVFGNETLKLDRIDIRVIDFGGNDVYHPAYQCTFQSNFLPILVVDIKRFQSLSMLCSPTKAVRRLCFDWMSHFYTANPTLGPALLVLTHKDQLDNPEQLDEQIDILTSTCEILRSKVVKKAESSNTCGTQGCINYFNNIANPLFNRTRIFTLGSDDKVDQLELMLKCINSFASEKLEFLPLKWLKIMNEIVDLEEPYTKLTVLEELYGDRAASHIVLRLMHKSGLAVWYEDSEPEISSLIFHQFSSIRGFVRTLFNHNHLKKWEQRINDYELNDLDCTMTQAEYEGHVLKYNRTALISEPLLIQVLRDEPELPVHISLALMRKFHLIHGPITNVGDPHSRLVVPHFVVPYFATSYHDDSWECDGEIRLRADFSLEGPLSLPRYVYHQLTVVLMQLLCNDQSAPLAVRNGAKVHHGGYTTYLVHHYHESRITLQVSTSVEKLHESWRALRHSMLVIKRHIERHWRGVVPTAIFFCGSCLLRQASKPEPTVNPFWIMQDKLQTQCGGSDVTYCLTEAQDVPVALCNPCKSMCS